MGRWSWWRLPRSSAGPVRRRPRLSWPCSTRQLKMADELRELILEHLTLVVIAMAVAIVLAVPAGIMATRKPGWRRSVLGFANIMQTVPSLALFGFLIPIPIIGGIGKRTAIVA